MSIRPGIEIVVSPMAPEGDVVYNEFHSKFIVGPAPKTRFETFVWRLGSHRLRRWVVDRQCSRATDRLRALANGLTR